MIKFIIYLFLSELLIVSFSPAYCFCKDSDIWFGLIKQENGVLIPFANYKDEHWRTLWDPNGKWPKFDGNKEIELQSVSDISKKWLSSNLIPEEWFLNSISGDKVRLKIGKPTLTNIHCEQRWSILTNFFEKLYPPEPISYIGIAASKDLKFQSFLKLTDNITTRNFSSIIKKKFYDLEETHIQNNINSGTAIISGKLDNYGHFISYQQRDKKSINISIFSNLILSNTHRIYFFEADRDYDNSSIHCNSYSNMTGWIILNNNSNSYAKIINPNFQFDCGRKDFKKSIPLGIVNLNGNFFIFLYEYYYELDQISIIQINDKTLNVLFTYSLGGC